MARLPTRDDLSPLPSARSGRTISAPDLTAIGRGRIALGENIAQAGQDVGNALSKLSRRQEDVADRRAQLDTYKRFNEFSSQQASLLDEAIGKETDGLGFAEKYDAGYREAAGKFLKSVPTGLAPQYDKALFDLERNLYTRAVQHERDKVRAYYQGNVRELATPLVTAATENPAMFARARDEVRAIAGMTELDPSEQQVEVDGFELTVAERLAREKPEQFETLVHEAAFGFSPETAGELLQVAQNQIDANNFAMEAGELTAEGQAYLETFRQVASGEVDADWIESNRDILGENGYHAALGEASSDDRDLAVRDELYGLSLTDPEQAMFTAWDEYSAGMISRETFATIYNAAADANTSEGRVRNQARAYLQSALGPDGSGRFEVVKRFESLLADKPEMSIKEMQEQADQLAVPFRATVLKSKLGSMERPRFALPSPQLSAQDMESAREETIRRWERGELSEEEAAREADIIRRWMWEAQFD